MNITLNGDARAIPDGLSVEGLLQHLGIVSKKVAVERNLEIVPKSTFPPRTQPVSSSTVAPPPPKAIW